VCLIFPSWLWSAAMNVELNGTNDWHYRGHSQRLGMAGALAMSGR
jgi:hypothetical protein